MFTFKYKSRLVYLMLWFLVMANIGFGQPPTSASPETEVLKIESHALTFNALVRDKHTRQPVRDLQRGDFRLLIDGKERSIDYFSFDGSERRPLKLMLYFNLAPEGALRYLSQAKAQESLKTSLSKLGSTDEVMVVAAYDWFVGKPEILTKLTRDWAKVAMSIAAATNRAQTAPPTDKTQKRTMSEALAMATQMAAATTSDYEVALVYISDGINTLDTMEFGSRKEIGANLLKANLSFSAVNFNMLRSYAAAAAIINPLAFAFGASVTGSANYLAEQSGGLQAEVEHAENFGDALEQVIQAYGNRYGFGIELDQKDLDGRAHKLELKINKNSHAKSRDLMIQVKRKFYAVPMLTRN